MMQNPDFHIAHIGINQADEEAALAAAKTWEALFGFSPVIGRSSVFTGDGKIEVMKKMYRGTHGHIAVGTADIDSAVEYLKKRGVAFAEETAVVKDGRLAAIYLSDEIAGFAVHLVRA